MSVASGSPPLFRPQRPASPYRVPRAASPSPPSVATVVKRTGGCCLPTPPGYCFPVRLLRLSPHDSDPPLSPPPPLPLPPSYCTSPWWPLDASTSSALFIARPAWDGGRPPSLVLCLQPRLGRQVLFSSSVHCFLLQFITHPKCLSPLGQEVCGAVVGRSLADSGGQDSRAPYGLWPSSP